MTDFVCAYCGEQKGDEYRSVEHPLSQTLGGSGWATRDVCGPCNDAAGLEVDQPFAQQTWILERRHYYEIPDSRGQVPSPPRVVSRLKATGERVLTVMDRNGWYAKPLPVEHWQDEKTVRFGVDAAEAPEYFEKKLKRLQKEFGEDVTLEGAEERTIENPEVEFNMTIDATLWPRFGAKNGLGFGREIFGEEWLSGPVASYLRDVLWGRDAVPPAPYAPLAPVSESLHETELDDYFERPLHVVTAMGTSHGAALGLFLFGDQRYLVPLGGELGDDVEGTWIVDPRNGTARRLSWSQYAQETAVRLVHAAEGGDSAEP